MKNNPFAKSSNPPSDYGGPPQQQQQQRRYSQQQGHSGGRIVSGQSQNPFSHQQHQHQQQQPRYDQPQNRNYKGNNFQSQDRGPVQFQPQRQQQRQNFYESAEIRQPTFQPQPFDRSAFSIKHQQQQQARFFAQESQNKNPFSRNSFQETQAPTVANPENNANTGRQRGRSAPFSGTDNRQCLSSTSGKNPFSQQIQQQHQHSMEMDSGIGMAVDATGAGGFPNGGFDSNLFSGNNRNWSKPGFSGISSSGSFNNPPTNNYNNNFSDASSGKKFTNNPFAQAQSFSTSTSASARTSTASTSQFSSFLGSTVAATALNPAPPVYDLGQDSLAGTKLEIPETEDDGAAPGIDLQGRRVDSDDIRKTGMAEVGASTDKATTSLEQIIPFSDIPPKLCEREFDFESGILPVFLPTEIRIISL